MALKRAKWTFLLYMAGDNNLEDYGTKDLAEMKSVGSSETLSLVAQFDRMSDQVTRRYYLTQGPDLQADSVAELPDTNTGNPQHLIDFLTWACTEYPADNYALVLWNHGAGWKDDDVYSRADGLGLDHMVSRGRVRSLSAGKPSRALFSTTLTNMVVEATKRAILFDDTAADFLDNQELQRVLAETAEQFGGRLKLLGFDACLMNMLEVAYQVKEWCDVSVGSQELEPGDGWPYDRVLKLLASDPDLSPEALGKGIVSQYNHFYRVHDPGMAVTQSALRLKNLEPVASAVSDLGDVLKAALDRRDGLGLIFGALRLAQSFSDRDYVDLLHFCRLLAQDDPAGAAGTAAKNVITIMETDASPVIAAGHHGQAVENATGLSIYLPTRVFSTLYTDLDFAQQYRWDEFLEALIGP